MQSLERKFKKLCKQNPCWSTFVCFAETISGIGFSRQSIHRWFNKLVDKNDYSNNDKKEVMAFLESIGKHSRATKNEHK